MIKHFCDRCKQEKPKPELKRITFATTDTSITRNTRDLCRQCVKQTLAYIDNYRQGQAA